MCELEISLQLPHEVVKMKEMCDIMLSLYPKDTYPLEALAKHYLGLGKGKQV